jgi:RNA polymerase sigma-70 factor, ECF subfamily
MAVADQGAMSLDLRAAILDTRFVPKAAAAPTADDPDLVRQARDGDREAFDCLYRRYAPMVHGMLLSRVPYGEVDDLLQDVFLLAFQRIRSLRQSGAFGGWLAAIARHRAIDYHRRPRLVPDPTFAPVGEEPGIRDRALAVLAVVRSLPDAYRETLTLRLVEGMTGPEIASLTGLTPASVRVNLHRGMKMLREQLARRGVTS